MTQVITYFKDRYFRVSKKHETFDKNFRVWRFLEQISRIQNKFCFCVKIFRGRPKSKKKFEFSLHPLLFRKIGISFVAPKKKEGENTMLIIADYD